MKFIATALMAAVLAADVDAKRRRSKRDKPVKPACSTLAHCIFDGSPVNGKVFMSQKDAEEGSEETEPVKAFGTFSDLED